jgi:hypothetical protein
VAPGSPAVAQTFTDAGRVVVSAPDVRARTDAVRQPGDEGHWWVVRVWFLVMLFGVVTVAGSRHFGVAVRDPDGRLFLTRLVVSLGILGALVLLDAGVRARGRGRTARRTLQVLRDRWTPRRVTLVLTGLLAYHVVYFCYRNLKSWNVFNEPRDDMLQRWDRWLFLGHDPAVLLHDLLGEHVAAYVLTGVYVSFSPLVMVSVVAALVLPDRVRQGYVFIASAMWVWILGVGAYHLIPSLGPFSHVPAQFDGLSHTWTQDTQARLLTQRAHLLAEPEAPDAVAGISAFASLHVAVVLMILLMARYYGLRSIARALAVYLALTMLATIYLGWHFVVDLPAGVAIAYAAVFLGRWMIYPEHAPWRPDLRQGGRGSGGAPPRLQRGRAGRPR